MVWMEASWLRTNVSRYISFTDLNKHTKGNGNTIQWTNNFDSIQNRFSVEHASIWHCYIRYLLTVRFISHVNDTRNKSTHTFFISKNQTRVCSCILWAACSSVVYIQTFPLTWPLSLSSPFWLYLFFPLVCIDALVIFQLVPHSIVLAFHARHSNR